MASILLLNGPAGAGKSTTAREFLRNVSGTWVYINQDDLRSLVEDGYATADGLQRDWSEETKIQWEVSILVCCDIARRYSEHGISCLVDFNASPEEFQEWKKGLNGLNYQVVILCPSRQTVLARNNARPERLRLHEDKILENYQKFKGWDSTQAVIIDNTSRAVTDVAEFLANLAQ